MRNKHQPENSKVIVLSSGGLDSTACIAYYLHHRYLVELLWVNYGQKAVRMESLAVRRIAKFYDLALQTVSLKGLNWKLADDDTEYPGRNAIMALLGATALSHQNGLVSLGIHAGTDYVDCSDSFQTQIADLTALLFHGLVTIDFPFATCGKRISRNSAFSTVFPLTLLIAACRALHQLAESVRRVLSVKACGIFGAKNDGFCDCSGKCYASHRLFFLQSRISRYGAKNTANTSFYWLRFFAVAV